MTYVQIHNHTHTLAEPALGVMFPLPHLLSSTERHHLFPMRKVIDENGASPERMGDTVLWAHMLYSTVFVYIYMHSYWLDLLHVLLNSEGAQNAELCRKLRMLIVRHELIRTESHVTVCCS